MIWWVTTCMLNIFTWLATWIHLHARRLVLVQYNRRYQNLPFSISQYRKNRSTDMENWVIITQHIDISMSTQYQTYKTEILYQTSTNAGYQIYAFHKQRGIPIHFNPTETGFSDMGCWNWNFTSDGNTASVNVVEISFLCWQYSKMCLYFFWPNNMTHLATLR